MDLGGPVICELEPEEEATILAGFPDVLKGELATLPPAVQLLQAAYDEQVAASR